MALENDLAVLESSLPELKAERQDGPLQNDVYEAVDDLCHLGHRAVAGDTRVNYPARVESDLALFQRLRDVVNSRFEEKRERYVFLLDRSEAMLREIAQIPLPPDGHLGVLKSIRHHFGFLFRQYGFGVMEEEPTGMRLRSGIVIVDVSWAVSSSLSFCLSRDDRNYWIEDLLYLGGDKRYQSVPQRIELNTAAEVDSWLQFISDVLREYGDEQLRNSPGAFERLDRAQAQRDAEYAAMMNAKYGSN